MHRPEREPKRKPERQRQHQRPERTGARRDRNQARRRERRPYENLEPEREAAANSLGDRRSGHRPATEEREQRGLQADRRGNREQRQQERAQPDRAHERNRHHQQQAQPDRYGGAGEEHGPAGRLHRAHDRLVLVVAARQLLAEAIDDQERVVDRNPEPDQLDQVDHLLRHRQPVTGEIDDSERAPDRAGREQERNPDGERDPEHGDQDDQRDRQRDPLAARHVLHHDRPDVRRDGRVAGDVDTSARQAVHDPANRLRLLLRLLGAGLAGDVGEEHVRPSRLQRFRAPVRKRRRGLVQARFQALSHHGAGRVGDRGDDEEVARVAVAELLLEDHAGAIGLGARDCELVDQPAGKQGEAGIAPDNEHAQPERDHRPAQLDHPSSPAFHRVEKGTQNVGRRLGSTRPGRTATARDQPN